MDETTCLYNRRRFQCNLCGMVCECPPEYFCGTDGQGKRLDYHQRPELSQGSVEFIAPQEYMVTFRPVSMLWLCVWFFVHTLPEINRS